MKKTTNYGLNMPEENDFYNVGDMNTNMEIIDREMKEAADAMQEEVSELKKSVSDGKSAVASAITDMGVSTDSDATFAEMAENVGNITPEVSVSGSVSGRWDGAAFRYGGGASAQATVNGKNETQDVTSFSMQSTNVGGNAAASDVLSGKSFSSNNAGRAVNGTMTNRGAYTYDLHCLSNNGTTDYSGIKIAIPAGYHNGSGYIRAHSHSGFAFCKTHTWNGYSYCTMSPNAGTYYSLDGVSESTETPLFVVLWESTAFTKVLDVVFVGDGWANRYISYTKDFSCWRNGTSVVVNKDSANKIADGTYMSAVILSFVGR